MRTNLCLPIVALLACAAPLCFTSSCHAHPRGYSSGGSSTRSPYPLPSYSSPAYRVPTYRPSTYRSPGEHYTRSYTRRDGTYVPGHYSTNADQDFYDNWSTKGNLNPHTGTVGTRVTPPYSERGQNDYRGTGQEGAGQAYNQGLYQYNRAVTPPARRPAWSSLGSTLGPRRATLPAPVSSAAPYVPSPYALPPAPVVAPSLPVISSFPQKVRLESADGNSYFGDVTAFDGTTYTVKTRYETVSIPASDVKTLELQ